MWFSFSKDCRRYRVFGAIVHRASLSSTTFEIKFVKLASLRNGQNGFSFTLFDLRTTMNASGFPWISVFLW